MCLFQVVYIKCKFIYNNESVSLKTWIIQACDKNNESEGHIAWSDSAREREIEKKDADDWMT